MLPVLLDELNSEIGLAVRLEPGDVDRFRPVAKVERIEISIAAIERGPILEATAPRSRRNVARIIGSVQLPLADKASAIAGVFELS
jgi:hypothetical protein